MGTDLEQRTGWRIPRPTYTSLQTKSSDVFLSLGCLNSQLLSNGTTNQTHHNRITSAEGP